jgi:hypothetical protein
MWLSFLQMFKKGKLLNNHFFFSSVHYLGFSSINNESLLLFGEG